MRRLYFCIAAAPGVAAAADANRISIGKPPGKVYDLGSYPLHMHCTGSGSPTVVINTGRGGSPLEWLDVQALLQQTQRTCVYVRAGYGWSDEGPGPRTAKVIAEELHELLERAARGRGRDSGRDRNSGPAADAGHDLRRPGRSTWIRPLSQAALSTVSHSPDIISPPTL